MKTIELNLTTPKISLNTHVEVPAGLASIPVTDHATYERRPNLDPLYTPKTQNHRIQLSALRSILCPALV